MFSSMIYGLLPMVVLPLVDAQAQWQQQDGVRHVPGATHKTLRPAVHWDHDLSDLSHLVPNDSIALYYTPNGRARPNMAHQFTHADHDLEYPGVVLEHSEYVGKVSCHAGAVQVQFTAQKAWQVVKDTWDAAGGFMIIEHKGGCGVDQHGQKAYWMAKSVTFNDESMTTHVTAEEMELRDALANVKLEFGMWQPSGRPQLLDQQKYDWAARSFAKPTPWKPRFNKLKRAFQFKGNFQPARAQVSPQDSCGAPLAAGPGGLPSAPCGTQFDQNLDNQIGYLNFSSTSQFAASLKEVAPNLADYNEADYNIPKQSNKPPGRHRRQVASYEDVTLEERGFFSAIGAWFAAAAQAVVDFVKKAAAVILETVTEIANLIGEAVTALLEEIGRFIIRGLVSLFGPDISVNIPLNLQAPLNDKNGPFAPATKIYSVSEGQGNTTQSISIYCVRCGVTGSVLVFGKFEFAPKGNSLTEGQIGAMGRIDGRLVLGIEAEYRKQLRKLEKPLIDVGLPGFSIPKLITVGPVAQIKASAGAYIKAQGLIEIGGEITIGPFETVLDLINKADTKTNYVPVKTKPIFSATGHLGGGVNLGLPISLGFGIVIPLINFEKTAAVIDEPYLAAELDYTSGDTSVLYTLKVGNSLTADIFGLLNYDLFLNGYYTVAKGKIPIPGIGRRAELVNAIEIESRHSEFGREERWRLEDQMYASIQARDDEPLELIEAREAPPPGTPDMTPPLTENTENFPTLNTAAIAEAKMYQNNPNGADVEKFGFSFTQIFDSTGNYHLLNEDNGNFGLSPAKESNNTDGGLEFETFKGAVVSDYGLRMIHYYENEMKQYGVSRFRLADPAKVPADSKMVVLEAFDINELQGLPASNTTDPLVYLPVDTDRNIFFTITCSYSDEQASKIFLAQNSETGPATLMDPDLQHTVTGGIVQECIFMPFVQNGGPGDEFGTGAGITKPPT